MRCFNMEETCGFQDFREIVAALRSDEGCPWDRSQTISSLKSCLLNETAEVLGAIQLYEKTKDGENLCEELGDLLLHIFLFSQIAEEEGLFNLDDVVQGISQKMLRRHPHVFGTGYRDENGELIRRWDEIKKIEKSSKTKEELESQNCAVTQASEEIIDYFKRMLDKD